MAISCSSVSYAGPSFLRVVVNDGGSGAWNMGLDEALLEDPFGGWPLRLYRWDRQTISLGYAQPHEQGVDTVVARRLGIPVVRRPTGGRAVLHADELTYALVGPVDQGPLSGHISQSYRRNDNGLLPGLRRLRHERWRRCLRRAGRRARAVRWRRLRARGRQLLGALCGALPRVRPDVHGGGGRAREWCRGCTTLTRCHAHGFLRCFCDK